MQDNTCICGAWNPRPLMLPSLKCPWSTYMCLIPLSGAQGRDRETCRGKEMKVGSESISLTRNLGTAKNSFNCIRKSFFFNQV